MAFESEIWFYTVIVGNLENQTSETGRCSNQSQCCSTAGQQPDQTGSEISAAPSELNNIFVLSGPGGVGKGTVVARLLETTDGLWLSRSWTTRDRRPGEAHDAYVFVSQQQFRDHVAAGGFLEWVEFLDYLQGTPLPQPPEGHDVLFEIDVAGAKQIKEMYPEAVLIFIDAPTAQEQRRRLESRGDNAERVQQRLDTAIAERAAAKELDCLEIINDDIELTTERLRDVIEQARSESVEFSKTKP